MTAVVLAGLGVFFGVLGWQILSELYKITDLLHDIAGAKRTGRKDA